MLREITRRVMVGLPLREAARVISLRVRAQSGDLGAGGRGGGGGRQVGSLCLSAWSASYAR